MKLSTALAVPVLLAAFGLAACDQGSQQQATQPGSDSGQQGQQTGAVPPGGAGRTGTPPGSGSDMSSPEGNAPGTTSPNTGAPSGQQTR